MTFDCRHASVSSYALHRELWPTIFSTQSLRILNHKFRDHSQLTIPLYLLQMRLEISAAKSAAIIRRNTEVFDYSWNNTSKFHFYHAHNIFNDSLKKYLLILMKDCALSPCTFYPGQTVTQNASRFWILLVLNLGEHCSQNYSMISIYNL